MKQNQTESCQKDLRLKTYKWHRKASRADLILKKAWRGVFKREACTTILSWPNDYIFRQNW